MIPCAYLAASSDEYLPFRIIIEGRGRREVRVCKADTSLTNTTDEFIWRRICRHKYSGQRHGTVQRALIKSVVVGLDERKENAVQRGGHEPLSTTMEIKRNKLLGCDAIR